jgi:hypothetical protein
MSPQKTKSGILVQEPRTSEPKGNAAYQWDDFDPDLYVQHNYYEYRDDDRRILQIVRDYFARALNGLPAVKAGVDVGSGANLYPALAMLPFCREITLWERGLSNVKWLNDEVSNYSAIWDPYWQTLVTRRAYREIDEPRKVLSTRAKPVKGDLYKLPRREWDLGTMFFVAESISDKETEFQQAVLRFIRSLTSEAPFAAAFMDGSRGYDVGQLHFPAVAVNKFDVQRCLEPLADDLQIFEVRSNKPLRDGYHGMILALGRARKNLR